MPHAMRLICELLSKETDWIFAEIKDLKKTKPLWERMVSIKL